MDKAWLELGNVALEYGSPSATPIPISSSQCPQFMEHHFLIETLLLGAFIVQRLIHLWTGSLMCEVQGRLR
jgi:hypothetical protein